MDKYIHIVNLIYFGKPTFFNKRIYYKEEFDGIEENLLLTNQPNTDVISLRYVCGTCKAKSTDYGIIAQIKILDNPQGQIIKNLLDSGIDIHFSPMFIGTINNDDNVVRKYKLYAIHLSDNFNLNNVYKREILTEKVIKFN